MRKVLLLLFVIFSSSLSASIYYIDPSGNDITGSGSAANPWRSLYKACNSVKTAGDIIHVNAGIYIETLACNLSINVSIEGEGTNSVIISHYQSTGGYQGLIQLTGGINAGQHISNLKLDGDNLRGYQAICVFDRDNVRIHDCVIVNFFMQGIKFGGGYQTGNSLYNNVIINCAGYTSDEHACLSVNDNSGMHIYNNRIEQNSRPDGQNGVCIESWQGLENCKIYNNDIIGTVSSLNNWSFAFEFWKTKGGIEIYNNRISGHIDFGKDIYKGNYAYGLDFHHNTVGWNSLQDKHTDGLQFEQTIESVIIRNNIFKNLETAIYFCQYNYSDDYVKDIYIYNNLLINVGMRGPNYSSAILFESGPIPPIYEDNINIWNNTIVADPIYPTDYGIWIPSSNRVTNLSIKNNIIVGFTQAPIYANLISSSGSINGLAIENNILYNNGNNNIPKYVNITPSNVTFRNNIVGDPKFVSSSDFHLSAGSPGIGAGIPISLITTDFEGSPVTNPPNIGCYATVAGIPNPTYISASIENSTPALLEINYNLTLANIVPPISAFSVTVNSSARSVNSIAISGTRVLLTLSSPIKYGDVVTVSYTVPSSNQLQTPAGGKAEALSTRTVTNRVNPPAVPVFAGAVVENATPSVITMTYSLSLANLVPAPSAFLVTVNSVARTVTMVAVSGTRVTLTLASPIVYGNNVRVAYTRPSSNPLQTPAGGLAASITAQTVSNNVNEIPKSPEIINTPPSVVVNYNPGTYSGFVGTINASGSYDANRDDITFSWKVPGNIPVSATNRSTIDFLAPILEVNQTYTFTLTVSDGKDPQTKTVPVTIIPYKPELEKAGIISVEASDFMVPYIPENIIDGNTGTIWSALGSNQWVILELDGSFDIHHVDLAFHPGQKKEFYFDILGSNDKVNWEPILSKSSSCAFSGNLQVFDFPATKGETKFRYVKLSGLGNSADDWNHIAEIRIFGFRYKNPIDYEDQIVKIYPNPAQKIVNIRIDEPAFVPDFVKIVSLTGKILYNDKVDPDIRQLQIPIGFKHGIYIVQMGTGNITMFTQKLIVSN